MYNKIPNKVSGAYFSSLKNQAGYRRLKLLVDVIKSTGQQKAMFLHPKDQGDNLPYRFGQLKIKYFY